VYPTSTADFAPQLMSLLEAQGVRLDPPLRRAMVSSLILLRNRNQVSQCVAPGGGGVVDNQETGSWSAA
jgi:hypothetical protein